MPQPVAPTEIANLCLDIIKTNTIEDIEMVSGDPAAEVMNRWYDVSKRKCLEGFPWNFASTRRAIALVSPAPAFGYTDKYQLPNDFVSLNWITDESLPLSQYNYTIEEDYILLNNSGAQSLKIGYVKDTDEVIHYTAHFKLYLAHQLAAFTAFKLTGQIATAKAIQALLQPMRLEAQAVNGLMNPPKAYRKSAMVRGRERFRGS